MFGSVCVWLCACLALCVFGLALCACLALCVFGCGWLCLSSNKGEAASRCADEEGAGLHLLAFSFKVKTGAHKGVFACFCQGYVGLTPGYVGAEFLEFLEFV